MKDQEKQQETKEVTNEVKLYLVNNNGGSSQWIDEARFMRERNEPFFGWTAVLKDGEPVYKVVSSKTVKLFHLRSADGAIDEWAREGELDSRLLQGWKKVMI